MYEGSVKITVIVESKGRRDTLEIPQAKTITLETVYEEPQLPDWPPLDRFSIRPPKIEKLILEIPVDEEQDRFVYTVTTTPAP